MGEAAAPRRAKSRIGDFAFSVLAAGLAVALLFLAGRHLFASSAVVAEQAARVAAAVPPSRAAAGSAPALRQRVAPEVPAVVSATASKQLSRIRLGAPRREARKTILPSHALTRPRNGPRATHPSLAAHAAPHLVRVATGNRHRVGAPGGNVRLVIAASGKQRLGRAAGGNVHSVHAASGEAPRPAAGHAAASRSYAFARPVRLAPRKLGGGRGAAERARSIVEPPLGYDARPTLVILPAAAQLELWTAVVPTIRTKRRH